ncbi:hypothetical protein TNCV_2155711 [Trichonephila clavipes]|nr:hypothetical protein TNCV_2155711 [Trichonephila clavipes]
MYVPLKIRRVDGANARYICRGSTSSRWRGVKVRRRDSDTLRRPWHRHRSSCSKEQFLYRKPKEILLLCTLSPPLPFWEKEGDGQTMHGRGIAGNRFNSSRWINKWQHVAHWPLVDGREKQKKGNLEHSHKITSSSKEKRNPITDEVHI